ncbi:tetratricopeptide repeat protein [Thiomicrorhabdus sp.]|uniref:tetratricopeptide repeat protein n=1 Tax=Thiomicrorhabdus sp. TaxID=2039724 RepID=UPI00356197BE
MSVLLEALKKAAENKKLGSESSEGADDIASVEQGSSTEDTVEIKEELKPDTATKPEPEKTDENADLKGVDVEGGPESNLLSGLQLVNEVKKEEPAETVKSIDDLELDLPQKEHHVSEEVASAINEEITDAGLDLKAALHVPYVDDAVENVEPVIEPPIENEKPLPKLVEEGQSALDESDKTSQDDSYSWSLSTLPGYESTPDTQTVNEQSVVNNTSSETLSTEHNQILSSDKRFRQYLPKSIRALLFGRSSNYMVYTLLSVLFLSFLGLFGIFYFQDQSQKLEQSMRKYDIVRLEPVKRPIVEPVKEAEEEKTSKPTEVSESEMVTELAETEEKVVAETETKPVENDIKDTVKTQPAKKTVYKSVIKPRVQQPSVVLNVQAVPVEPYVQNAYQALYDKNYDKAKDLFEKALLENNEDIQALNGLGAVYAKLNQENKALEQYYKVLEISSDDIHAFEAIISLTGSSLSGEEWKNEIKRVLVKHPDSAILNYALGNIYAGEKDWDKAQVAYFDAHRLDETNPDYLVNLAISLDHLGQYALAEKYYTLGLVHAESKTVYFDVEQVKLRLASIKQYIGQTDL